MRSIGRVSPILARPISAGARGSALRPARRLQARILHRQNLEAVLPRFGVTGLGEDEKRDLNVAWHRLDAWPDVPPGLTRLKKKFWLAPLSNGNISLMVDLARRNNFPGTPFSGPISLIDFKPKPRVYLAARGFRSQAARCMLVAAHSNDLAAATASACTPRIWRGRTSRSRPRRSRAERAGRLCGKRS